MLRIARVGLLLGCTVAVCLAAGVVTAEVYDANAQYVASELGDSPAAEFGTWSLGYRAYASGYASTDFTVYTGHTATGDIRGWYLLGAPYQVPQTYVNVSGTDISGNLAKDQIGMHPGTQNISDHAYTLLRWTAPKAGKIDIASVFNAPNGTSSTDVHLVLNGTSIWDGAVNNGSGATASLTGTTVAQNDVLDLVVGPGTTPAGGNDWTGVFHTVSYQVPEPGALSLLVGSVFGLLAYAWRRRR